MNTVPISVEARKVFTGETMVSVIGEIDLATTPKVQKAVSRYTGPGSPRPPQGRIH